MIIGDREFHSIELATWLKKEKQKRKNKSSEEPWYILTSLENEIEVIKIYEQRMGIEMMFKDYKTGGYNLEGSKANIQRLTNVILLIAIAYTNQTLKGRIIKNKGQQKYIVRPQEKRRKTKRNSEFWIGLYGELWVNKDGKYEEEIGKIIMLNSNKLTFYRRGLKAKDEIMKVYE